MSQHTKYNGFAIALAWPETYCRQAGAWYDPLMRIMGFSKDYYYKVGHAAMVLVESNSGKCRYFDFGRYHAPHGHGRVRDEETDHDLIIHTKATFDSKHQITNFVEILAELQKNPSCHGTGTVHAAYCKINFEKAYHKAKQMQHHSPHRYGPFVWKGTNCSRFVRTVMLAGKPTLKHLIKIQLPLTVSPSPKGNVKSLSNYAIEPIGFSQV